MSSSAPARARCASWFASSRQPNAAVGQAVDPADGGRIASLLHLPGAVNGTARRNGTHRRPGRPADRRRRRARPRSWRWAAGSGEPAPVRQTAPRQRRPRQKPAGGGFKLDGSAAQAKAAQQTTSQGADQTARPSRRGQAPVSKSTAAAMPAKPVLGVRTASKGLRLSSRPPSHCHSRKPAADGTSSANEQECWCCHAVPPCQSSLLVRTHVRC